MRPPHLTFLVPNWYSSLGHYAQMVTVDEPSPILREDLVPHYISLSSCLMATSALRRRTRMITEYYNVIHTHTHMYIYLYTYFKYTIKTLRVCFAYIIYIWTFIPITVSSSIFSICSELCHTVPTCGRLILAPSSFQCSSRRFYWAPVPSDSSNHVEQLGGKTGNHGTSVAEAGSNFDLAWVRGWWRYPNFGWSLKLLEGCYEFFVPFTLQLPQLVHLPMQKEHQQAGFTTKEKGWTRKQYQMIILILYNCYAHLIRYVLLYLYYYMIVILLYYNYDIMSS